MKRFDADTAITLIDATTATGQVVAGWDVIDEGPPNGGYLLAIALRAMKTRVDHPHLATTTAHFLRPVAHGQVVVTTEVAKVGRRLSTVTATLSQDGDDRMRIIAAFADLAAPGPSGNLRPPLQLPPPAECRGVDDADRGSFVPPTIARRLSQRYVPDDVGWTRGHPGTSGLLRGWGCFEDGRPMDDLGLAVLCDAFPPAVFNAGLPISWAPTIELTLHVRHPGPLEGPIACHFQSKWATSGFVEEDGIIETADGEPVAMSRQLLLAPRTA